jgi:hypothetical protein
MFIPDTGSRVDQDPWFPDQRGSAYWISDPTSWPWIFFHPGSGIRDSDPEDQKRTGSRTRITAYPYDWRGFVRAKKKTSVIYTPVAITSKVTKGDCNPCKDAKIPKRQADGDL